MTQQLCACGCGQPTSPVKNARATRGYQPGDTARFIKGHNRRRPRPTLPDGPQLCACGCGEPTPLATLTVVKRGLYKGQPVRFLPGHHTKGSRNHVYNPENLRMLKSGRYQVRQPDGSWEYRARVVMAEQLGRPLLSREIVHHKDGNKANDDPANLEVCNGHDEHYRRHYRVWSQEEVCAALQAIVQQLGYAPTASAYRQAHYEPGLTSIYHHFGSWTRALEAAGVLALYQPRSANQFIRAR